MGQPWVDVAVPRGLEVLASKFQSRPLRSTCGRADGATSERVGSGRRGLRLPARERPTDDRSTGRAQCRWWCVDFSHVCALARMYRVSSMCVV
jgi:hypothetical protein